MLRILLVIFFCPENKVQPKKKGNMPMSAYNIFRRLSTAPEQWRIAFDTVTQATPSPNYTSLSRCLPLDLPSRVIAAT